MKKKNHFKLLLAASLGWAIIIFVCCTVPSGDLPRVRIPGMDKLFHFAVFFVQSVWLSMLLQLQTKSRRFQLLLTSLSAFGYGGLIELLQSSCFHRSGELLDLAADLAGGIAGAVCYPAIRRGCGRLFKRNK
jgi:VanZ family protein